MKLTNLDRVHIRKTHPAMWRVIMTASLAKVALAVNFWYSNPTFNPWEIPKDIIGVVFVVLGVSQIIFLNLIHDLRLVRAGLALSITWLIFWGASNTQQFFAGNASLQLPLMYLALAALQAPLLFESPINATSMNQAAIDAMLKTGPIAKPEA